MEYEQNQNKTLIVISYSIYGLGEKIVRTIPIKLLKNLDFKKEIVSKSNILLEYFFLDLLTIIKKHLVSLNRNMSDFFNMVNYENSSIDNNTVETNKKYVCYFHNGSGFDFYFLLNTLMKSKKLQELFNLSKNLKVVEFNNRIYSLKFHNLIFFDSYLLTKKSLNTLSKVLLNQEKNKFDISLMKTYDDLKKTFLSTVEYRKFRQYNFKDSILLHKCMTLLQDTFWNAKYIDISNYRTTSALGFSLFRTKYYTIKEHLTFKLITPKEKNPYYKYFLTNTEVNLYNCNDAIFITPSYLEKKLQSSFYGGRTELYIPKLPKSNNTVLYLDVNSLYPFAGLAPLPSGPALYKSIPKDMSLNIKDLNNFMGFLYIKFVSPADSTLLPVLPRKHPKKHNVYALGCGEGWYFCKEVLLAIKMGYKVYVQEVIEFGKKPFLKKFVKELYTLRQKYSKGHPLNLLYKDILNSTSYGRFCIRSDTEELEKFDETTNDITVSKFYKNKTEKSLKSRVRENYYSNSFYSYDYGKNQSLLTPQSKLKQLNNALHISSAITAQARVTMYHFLEPFYRENSLLYTDTDSLFIEKSLSENNKSYKSLMKRIDNNKIGYFKIEKDSETAFFLAPKFYITLTNNALDIKCKGLTKELLLKALKLDSETNNTNPLIASFDEILENEGLLTVEVKNVPRLKKAFKKLKIEASLTPLATYTNINIEQYRKKIYTNINRKKVWTNTASLLLDEHFNECSFLQLEEKYNTFKTNILL